MALNDMAGQRPIRGRMGLWVSAPIIGLVVSGCFTYAPAELGGVLEGRDVRVHISRQGLADLPEIPDEVGSVIGGRLMSDGPNQILVRMPIALQVEGLVTRSIGQNLTIPARYIESVEVREFNRSRTGIATAGGLGIALLIILGFREGRSEQPPDLPEPPEESTRIPVSALLSLLGRH